VTLTDGGFQDGGDQVGVRREREEFARPGADRRHRRIGVLPDAAGHHRHQDPFRRQRLHEMGYVVRHVAQHDVGVRVLAQACDARFDVVGLGKLGAARDRDARRLA